VTVHVKKKKSNSSLVWTLVFGIAVICVVGTSISYVVKSGPFARSQDDDAGTQSSGAGSDASTNTASFSRLSAPARGYPNGSSSDDVSYSPARAAAPVQPAADSSDPPVSTAPRAPVKKGEMSAYIQTAMNKVKDQLTQPEGEASGRARVSFTINSDGSLGDLKFLESASPDSANQVVEDAVRKAAPFDPLPEGNSSATLQITIDYSQAASQPASAP
jgi:TonB family protein